VRVLAPVLIVLIIAVFVLIAIRMTRKQDVRKAELDEAKRQARVARTGLKQIQSDIGAQVTAGYVDLSALARHVQDTLDGMEPPERKELAR
jgi:type II secretory pathway pseudopilin PulG